MKDRLDRTHSYESSHSSSLKGNYNIQGNITNKEKVSPASSLGKPPTYTLQKAARMAAKVNNKWIRIASVLAYFIAISTLGVVLAMYYILFYDPYRDCCTDEHDDYFPAEDLQIQQPILKTIVVRSAEMVRLKSDNFTKVV